MKYLNFEKNYIRKKWKNKISIALVFPNYYKVGMSNLGFIYIYESLNKYKEIVCERIFLPEKQEPPKSLENNRILKDFDFILFSIPFELDYVNVIKILNLGGILLDPLKRKEIIIAGGIATWLNPEPLAPFVDGFLLGEWEEIEEKIIPLCLKYYFNKKKFLEYLNEYPFSYVPHLENKKSIKIIKSKNLKKVIYSEIISEQAEFRNSYLIEVSKGCGRACRFCAIGFLSRPPRSHLLEKLEEVIEKIPQGAKVGLIGLEFADKKEVLAIGKRLLEKNCLLTFSSLRIDALSEEFLELFKGLKSIAIAPETGSERIKKIINKNLTEEEIFFALNKFQEKGLKKVKIYFMLGLPFETEEDLEETIKLVKKILNKKFKLNFSFSFSFFVPKPHTPFQWYPFLNFNELKQKERFIKKKLSYVKNIKIENPQSAYFQAIIARGDKRLKEFLILKAKGESFKRCLKFIPSLNEILVPQNSLDNFFPWDKIDTGIKKEFLWKEWLKAKAEQLTPFCNLGRCHLCGVC